MLALLIKSVADADWLALVGLLIVIGLLGMREFASETQRRSG